MAKKRAKGGNITTAQAAAKIDIAEKCALIAVPVPNAGAKPKVSKATTINDAIGNLNVSFKVKLKKLDESSNREKVDIQSMDDFEEHNLVQQSATLREQKQQMNFLHEFQSELRTNTALREELMAILKDDNKEKLIHFLKGWVQQFKKPEPQFLQLLQSTLSNN